MYHEPSTLEVMVRKILEFAWTYLLYISTSLSPTGTVISPATLSPSSSCVKVSSRRERRSKYAMPFLSMRPRAVSASSVSPPIVVPPVSRTARRVSMESMRLSMRSRWEARNWVRAIAYVASLYTSTSVPSDERVSLGGWTISGEEAQEKLSSTFGAKKWGALTKASATILVAYIPSFISMESA